uniref:Uncharacterized protein n=1 Tax=blood disease bacterium R229 TaxID=741978 RepID=G2ZKL2_9RALS|nr:hypothetical protein BDB_60185 [blood disease bacterium R229]
MTDGGIGSLASNLDGFITTLEPGFVPRDPRQMGALRAPVANANVLGRGMPTMAACTLPFQLGPVVDIGVGDTEAAALRRHLAHRFNAEPELVVCTVRTPLATANVPGLGSPLVPLCTPEAVAGIDAVVSVREALPAMLLCDAVQLVQPVLAKMGIADRLVCAQSAPFAAYHDNAACRPLVTLGATEAIEFLHPGIGLRQPFAAALACGFLDTGKPGRVAQDLATLDVPAVSAPTSRQDPGATRFELVAEPAAKEIHRITVAVAGRQAFAAGLPGDLLQARELCLGLARRAVDQETEGMGAGAGCFMPVGAAEPIAGGPASPFVVKEGVALLCQALAQSGQMC